MMTNSNDATDARRPRRNALIWIAVLLIVFVAVALNLDRLKSLWGMGAEVFQLRSAVQENFDVKDVSINLKRSAAGNRLSVELTNPPFEDLTGPELEAKAKEVATLAYREYGSQHNFEQFSVVVVDEADTMITISRKQEFQFSAEELSADNEAGAEASGG